MAETGDDLAIVQFAFRTEFAVVQLAFVLGFSFVEDHVKKKSLALRVREHDFPLGKLAEVEVQIVPLRISGS